MIRIFSVLAFTVAVAARPNVPTVIFDANAINSVATDATPGPVRAPTIELHKTNVVHDQASYRQTESPVDYIRPEAYLNHLDTRALVAGPVATPYGHHGGFFSGHIGQIFSPHHYIPSFWFPPPIFPSFAAPAYAPAPAPAAKPEPADGPAEEAPALPFIPLASQILDGLFWMPLQQLLINVQQALTQPPPKKDSDSAKSVPTIYENK